MILCEKRGESGIRSHIIKCHSKSAVQNILTFWITLFCSYFPRKGHWGWIYWSWITCSAPQCFSDEAEGRRGGGFRGGDKEYESEPFSHFLSACVKPRELGLEAVGGWSSAFLSPSADGFLLPDRLGDLCPLSINTHTRILSLSRLFPSLAALFVLLFGSRTNT